MGVQVVIKFLKSIFFPLKKKKKKKKKKRREEKRRHLIVGYSWNEGVLIVPELKYQSRTVV